MIAVPYKVYVVVDRGFGEQLASLTQGVPVWIVDAPPNRVVARRLWKERDQEDHLTTLPVLRVGSLGPLRSSYCRNSTAIDLHQGSYSSEPPYTVIEVLGTPLSDRIKAELSRYDFNDFHSSVSWFHAVRPPKYA